MNHHSTSRTTDTDRAVLYARFADIQRQADLACDAIDRGAPDRTLNNAIEKLELAVHDFAVARLAHGPHDDEASAESLAVSPAMWPELAGSARMTAPTKATRGEFIRDLLRRWKNRGALRKFSALRG